MTDSPITVGPPLVITLALLTVSAAVVVRLGRIGTARSIVVAAVRAAIQLAAVSLLIAAVVKAPAWTALFVLVMFTVATITSATRIGSLRTAWRVAGSIAAGAAPVLALLLATGSVATAPIVLIPVAGILIGGAMTATSLAGTRALDELRARHGEYEAALALGFLPRVAALEICRPTAGQALIPGLDQTRTVGLVTLPGAFVGVLLGGGGPIQAGITQLVVLISIVVVQAVAVLVTVELVANGLVGRPAGASRSMFSGGW
jgi:putative ABC transport system permease protein